MNRRVGARLLLICIMLLVLPSTVWAKSSERVLDEGWSFYNQQLLKSENHTATKTATVTLPLEFSDVTGNVSGYGTFIQTIDVPELLQHKLLALELPFTYSASKIFINGEFYEEVGRVSSNNRTHERSLRSVLIPIKSESETLEIAIQVSSFNHIRGGFSAPPVLGEWEGMYASFLTERYAAIFIATIIFIAGVMTLVIGILERNERMFLTFGLFAIVVAVRGLVAVPFLYHDLPLNMSYEMATRLEYFTTNVCFSLYAIFIYLLYNRLFSKWILYPGLALLWTLALLSLFADIEMFQEAFFSMFAVMSMFVLYNISIMIRAFFSNLVLAKSLLLGVLFVFVGLIVDFLTGMGILYVPPLANFMIAMNVLIVLFSLCFNYVKNMRIAKQLNNQLDEEVKARTAELHVANLELQRLVQLDGLTGIFNRHKFDTALKEAFQASVEANTPLSLLMMDIDEFKKYNDYYGHVKGDALLVCIATFIQEQLSEETIFARYGGEEFAIILPNTTIEYAAAIGEHLRTFIAYSKWEHLGRTSQIVTISLGCAERITDNKQSAIALIEVADNRLYASKHNGRNQITAHDVRAMQQL